MSDTCRILVPQPGIKPISLALQHRFLTTGPPGTSLPLFSDQKMRSWDMVMVGTPPAQVHPESIQRRVMEESSHNQAHLPAPPRCCGPHIIIHCSVKQVASPGWMHETGCLGLVHWDDPEGWGERWEGGSGWGTHVHPWLIHVDVWQKPLQYYKVISLQLN